MTYVYLDPANPPQEIMLQWQDGTGGWEHRAYWGQDLIAWGTNGTGSRRNKGAIPMPASAQWVRLEVTASEVGLEGQTAYGAAFTTYEGTTSWDHSAKVSSVAKRPFGSRIRSPQERW